MGQVLLYSDDRTLAAYLAGAAAVVPDLVRARVDALAVSGKGGDSRALVFAFDDPALPGPGEDAPGVRLAKGALDRGTGVVSVKTGRTAQPLQVRGGIPAAPRELARALPPVPWSKAPEDPAVVFLVAPGAALARLVREHLELGHDDLRYAALTTPEGPRVALEVERPSWFILERVLGRDPARPGAGAADPEVSVYRRVGGPLGGRRIAIAWGLEHVLEPWLVDPKEERALLLVDAQGEHRVIDRGQLKDVGQLLDLDPSRFGATRLEATGDPGRIEIHLRLEGRAVPRDPELWVLPWAQREHLEQLLAGTPEDELRNLLVAAATPAGGERLLLVREALTGRAPRLLPLGKRAYAPIAGLPNLLVPCDRVLAPPLATDRYVRAFGVRPGELLVVDEVQGKLEPWRVEERLFRPIETVIDFVADAEATRLDQVVLQAPFDLGPFSEEDLAPTGATGERRGRARTTERGAEPARGERQAEVGPAPAPKAAPKRAPAPKQAEARVAAGTDPRRERIAKLERQLVLERTSPEAWLELMRLRLQDGDAEEALRSAEHALWELRGDAEGPALRDVEATLAQPSAAGEATALWRRVLAFPAEAKKLVTHADRYHALTERTQEALRAAEGRLRKRARWLLWRLVLAQTTDAIEAERQREDILAELVLRGVEDHEVPAFVRHVLLEHHGRRAASGDRAPDALNLLQRAQQVAGGLKHGAVRAEALAHTAWALAELGDAPLALAAAKQAQDQAEPGQAGERGARETPQHRAFRARALARVGAVLERASGRGKGRELLERSLQTLVTMQGEAKDSTEGDRGLVSWVGTLADLRGGAAGDDPLLDRALKALGDRPPEKRAPLLKEVAKDLVRLGAGKRGQEMARELLRLPRLPLAPREDAVEALEALVGEQGVPTADDAQRMEQALLAAGGGSQQDEVDEFALPMMRLLLRAHGARAAEAAERLRQQFASKGSAYAAHWARIAGLHALAEARDRQRGPQLLAEALADAWQHKDQRSPRGEERMRLVMKLAQLVPAFGMRERGLELLDGVQRRAAEEPDLYVRNELLMASVLAASKLGESKAAFELVEGLARTAIDTFRAAPARGGGEAPRWLMFETLEHVADAAVEMGDARRGLPLVQRIADTAHHALDQAGQADSEGRFFYCRALVRAGRAALALGDAPGAEKAFADAFTRMRQLKQLDLVDLLGLAVETASEMDGAPRYALARQVLEVTAGSGATGELFDRAQIEQVMARLARDMVQGESAYAAALKRWKGREERSIRDRVATEQVGS